MKVEFTIIAFTW